MVRDREASQEPAAVAQVRDDEVMNPANGSKSGEECRDARTLEERVHRTLASIR